MFLSRSRGFGAALVIVLLYLIFDKVQKVKISLLFAVLSFFLFFVVVSYNFSIVPILNLTRTDINVISRFALWEKSLNLFYESPLFGFGIGVFQQVNNKVVQLIPNIVAYSKGGFYLPQIIPHDPDGGQHVHNVYLQMLTEGGLTGLLLLVLFLYKVFVKTRKTDSFISIAPNSKLNPLVAFNDKIIVLSLIYLCFAGISAGYTLFPLHCGCFILQLQD